jgi:hypothetical protein
VLLPAEQAAQRPDGCLRVAWVGAAAACFDWLLERAAREAQQVGLEFQLERFEHSQLPCALASLPDRLVIGCTTRLGYPWQSVRCLQGTPPSALDPQPIPWGVVTDTWWDGARRTGIGAVSHWQQPWYRWWDGWREWFLPDIPDATIGGAAFAPVLSVSDSWLPRSETPPTRTAAAVGRLVLVCECHETAVTWQAIAAQVGVDTQWWRNPQTAPNHAHAVRWILWDDSRLATAGTGLSQAATECATADTADTADGMQPAALGEADAEAALRRREAHAMQECLALREQFPEARLLAACAFPRWDFWQALERAGVDELIVKPSSGLGLAAVLRTRAVCARSG